MEAINILLVDDDQDDQLMFAHAVKEINNSINCWYTSNGQEALNLVKELKENPPNIVFLDLNMMPVSGKECLCELRKIDWFKSIPIIIYTTSDNASEGSETEKLGATYFLTKRNSLIDIKSDIEVILQTFVSDFAMRSKNMLQ